MLVAACLVSEMGQERGGGGLTQMENDIEKKLENRMRSGIYSTSWRGLDMEGCQVRGWVPWTKSP